jgi:hypothetical protein
MDLDPTTGWPMPIPMLMPPFTLPFVSEASHGGDHQDVLILWMTPLLARMSTATALALLNMMVNTDIDAFTPAKS